MGRMRFTRSALLVIPLLFAVGCNDLRVAEFGLPLAGGGLPVTVLVRAGVDPADVAIALDGQDVRSLFAPGPAGLVATLPLPTPGAHEIAVTQPNRLGLPELHKKSFAVPAPTPALVSVTPTAASIPARNMSSATVS